LRIEEGSSVWRVDVNISNKQ